MSLSSAALECVQRGLCVFPLKPGTKEPNGILVPHGFKDASRDAEVVARLWQAEPASGIGIACAPSGLVVLDIDPRNGGDDTLRQLLEELGPLPATWTCSTPSGGVHLYFADDGHDYRGTLGKGIDIKSKGYVVAPPSLHPCGQTYSWASGMHPDEVGLARLPDAWFAAMIRPKPPAPRERTPLQISTARGLERRARAYIDTMDPAISGSYGHTAAFAVARTLYGWILEGLPESTAWQLFNDYNGLCQPPWRESDLEHKWEEAKKAQHIPSFPDRPKPKLRSIQGGAVTDQELGPDADDNDAAEPVTDTTSSPSEAPVQSLWNKLALVPPSNWYSETPPRRTWLLRDGSKSHTPGLLPLGKVGEIIAEGGAGKTMVLCQLAIAVATSSPWLGTMTVATSGRVLLVLGEEDQEEVRRRLYHASRASKVPPPDAGKVVFMPLAGLPAPMIERDGDGNLVAAEFLRWLVAYVVREQFCLVIIDPLSRFAGDDAEIDNAAATRFIQGLESIAVASGATVLVAHHTNKVSRGKMGTVDASSGRGASALVDGARWQCALSVEKTSMTDVDDRDRLSETVTFAVTKSNYATKPDPIVLRRDPANGGALLPIDNEDAEVLQHAKVASSPHAARASAREAIVSAATQGLDRRVVDAVRAHPGASSRYIRAFVMSSGKCGMEKALDAMLRVEPHLVVMQGVRNSKTYSLPTDASSLPEYLR